MKDRTRSYLDSLSLSLSLSLRNSANFDLCLGCLLERERERLTKMQLGHIIGWLRCCLCHWESSISIPRLGMYYCLDRLYMLWVVFNISPKCLPCYTEWMECMSHRKWRETKQQPSMLHCPAVPGCCLVSFEFLCDIPFIHFVTLLQEISAHWNYVPWPRGTRQGGATPLRSIFN